MSLSLQCHLERGAFSLDVDLSVPSRHVVGIVGENGSGKTSTLDMIAGLMPCTTGTITIDDVLVDESTTNVFVQPEHRQVATVFQGGGLLPHLSVERNVAFGRGRSLRSAARFEEIIGAFDLAKLLKRRPNELSGGQRQRVSLARAFLSPSRVMLLDEPTTFLDTDSRTSLRRMMKESFSVYEGTIVIVSHDRADIDELVDTECRVQMTRSVTTSATLSNC